MTPQEKAAELVRKFKPLVTFSMGVHQSYILKIAKKCALVAVDEIIEVLSKDINPLVNYWFEVKQEIKKL